ncbi:MAG: helix-turn-helix transcriptional regulator [Opitutus sp.]|nr:helix-turn-helix transcriptional regulator [Opitutus sp.]MCS6275744.1 helix-turn-helix transcriptional regulator [Opitutus sp.]MCS6300840.1 helix-turn-helix transcriptional regulator [Opitutus sp.]
MQGDFQLVVIEAGEARVTVGEDTVHLAKGDAGLFCPGRREHFLFSQQVRTHHTWCAVNPVLVAPELAQACGRAPAVIRETHRLARLMELGLGLPEVTGTEASGLVEALGLAVLREYVYAAQHKSGAGEKPEALRRLLEWFGLHAAEPVDLPRLAKVAGVSAAQLVKVCKRHLGVTPVRALWEARTRQGVRLLRDTGLPVAEVAFRCGFQTPFHFSRWVKALTGASPRAVRLQAAWR